MPSVLLNLATFTFKGRETRFALRNPSETEPPVRLAPHGDFGFYYRYYCEVKILGTVKTCTSLVTRGRLEETVNL